jgi:hypothetical protein
MSSSGGSSQRQVTAATFDIDPAGEVILEFGESLDCESTHQGRVVI